MRRCWGLRGQRVIKRCQQRCDWDYIYGAIDCPELNPTGKIRDQFKDVVCNKVFDGIEAMREELLPKLKSFWESPGGLSSLVGNNWLRQKANAS